MQHLEKSVYVGFGLVKSQKKKQKKNMLGSEVSEVKRPRGCWRVLKEANNPKETQTMTINAEVHISSGLLQQTQYNCATRTQTLEENELYTYNFKESKIYV